MFGSTQCLALTGVAQHTPSTLNDGVGIICGQVFFLLFGNLHVSRVSPADGGLRQPKSVSQKSQPPATVSFSGIQNAWRRRKAKENPAVTAPGLSILRSAADSGQQREGRIRERGGRQLFLNSYPLSMISKAETVVR